MSRLLFWLALGVLVVFAIRAKIREARLRAERDHFASRAGQAGQGGQAHTPGQAPIASVETMTSCAHCGLHFPASEAVHADGLDYCCPAHVRLPAQ